MLKLNKWPAISIKALGLAVVLPILSVVSGSPLYALSQSDLNSIYNDTVWYDTDTANIACGGTSSPSDSNIVWPFATKSSSQFERVDQGWDLQAGAGAAVYAISPGIIHQYAPDSGGFGNDYPTEQLDSSIGGPTNWVYYGHVHVLKGVINKHVQAGEQIAVANTTDPQNGSVAPPGWLEIGFAQPKTDAPADTSASPDTAATPAGQKMKDLLLNASPGTPSGGSNGSTSGGCACLAAGNAGGGDSAPPSQQQIDNAKTIMGIAKTESLGQQGALIALMAALDESRLLNLANSQVPVSESNPAKQGDGSNYDSLGLFQQRVASGWSTLAPAANLTIEGSPSASQAYANQHPSAVFQIMAPAYAGEAFFGSPPGTNAPSALSKGLQDVARWQTLQPWVAAQDVQHSGTPDGSNYRQFLSDAQSLLNKYWDSANPVSLPVPLKGGNGSGGTNFSC